MSKISTVFWAVILSGLQWPSIALAVACEPVAHPAWSLELKEILDGCTTEIISPNGRRILTIDNVGEMTVRDTGGRVMGRAKDRLVPPAVASWSPKSDSFFVSDGDGSGQTSELQVYEIHGAQITFNTQAHRNAVREYRKRVTCSSKAADPDVWGLHWTDDGKYVLLLVQATIHEPCGDASKFFGMKVGSTHGEVVEVLTDDIARTRWAAWLPTNLRAPRANSPQVSPAKKLP